MFIGQILGNGILVTEVIRLKSQRIYQRIRQMEEMQEECLGGEGFLENAKTEKRDVKIQCRRLRGVLRIVRKKKKVIWKK